MNNTTSVAMHTQGASSAAFITHPGYGRMFRPNRLTLGGFLPLRFFQGDMAVLQGQAEVVEALDQYGFAASRGYGQGSDYY